ncbi:MAG: site-specific integrase [Planctomycetales bacterium]|nr:site-specific integrase [Planctomycetales bacterium]
MPRKPRFPSYRLHKPSGQAVVTINGRDFYLGVFDSEQSKACYEKLIAEWLSNGRELPQSASVDGSSETGLTIVELIARYLRFAKTHYRKNGQVTNEMTVIKPALAGLRELYGRSQAAEFGPKSLKTVRQLFVDKGLARSTCNKYTNRIVRAFRWACSEELIPAHIHHGLASVTNLQKGRTTARETEDVRPVADSVISATTDELNPVVADMVQLQRVTGMRPAEVCEIKPCSIDRSGDIWLYTPDSHKNEHRGKSRIVPIGPRAQELLAPYLLRDQDSHCFNPSETVEQVNREKRLSRKTPVQPSQQNRVKKSPDWTPGDRYTTASYRRAIYRAAKRAGVEQWSPNRLRHTAGTEIRKHHGLEAAQVVLGHSQASTTELYAERDLSLAMSVAAQIG